MAYRRTGDNPLSEAMIALFTDVWLVLDALTNDKSLTLMLFFNADKLRGFAPNEKPSAAKIELWCYSKWVLINWS